MDKSINSIMMAPLEGALFSTAKMRSPRRLYTLETNGLVVSTPLHPDLDSLGPRCNRVATYT